MGLRREKKIDGVKCFSETPPVGNGSPKKKNLASTYKSTSSIFSVRKSLLKPSLWSLWPALLFLKTDLLCTKILCFSIETCLLCGDIDVSFLAGVMIWWIRISKPGTILAFMLVFFFLCVSLSRFFFLPSLVSRFKSSFLKWIQIFILRMCELAAHRMLFNC